jgi:hypothetical protein
MSLRLKTILAHSFLYGLLAVLAFYIWRDVKFHWYLVPMVGISIVVKAIWWRRQKHIDGNAANRLPPN